MQIFFLIKNLRYAKHEEIMALTAQLGHRQSNAERRLRELCEVEDGKQPEVEAVKNGKSIVGYRLIQKNTLPRAFAGGQKLL